MRLERTPRVSRTHGTGPDVMPEEREEEARLGRLQGFREEHPCRLR